VYSIAMTLLVLELRLPAVHEPLGDAALWSALFELWPKLLIWLLSFWVLAVFWISDVRALAMYASLNRFLLRLSLGRLALVSLLRFSTALIGEHGDHVAGAAVYAGHLFGLALVPALRLAYLRQHPADVTWPDAQARSEASVQAWSILICSAAALGLAFVAPGYNMFALLPVPFWRVFHRILTVRGATAG
jgi:uncharacterized membrane protein